MPAHPNDRVIACSSQHGDKWMTLSNANSVIITWFTRLSARPDGGWALHPGVKRQPPTLRPPPINCSVLASLCDKNVKIDGAAALGQQLDGRQRGRWLARARSQQWREGAGEMGASPLEDASLLLLPGPWLSRTKETTHWGQNSFSVICALIGRRRRKRVCGACRMIGSMSAGAENCSPSQASLPLHPSPPCDRQLGRVREGSRSR